MTIFIRDENLLKLMKEIEAECDKHLPDGFATLGQVAVATTAEGEELVCVEMGIFTKAEVLSISPLIKNRSSRSMENGIASVHSLSEGD